MYCHNCGAQVEDSFVFCRNCGAKIQASSVAHQNEVRTQSDKTEYHFTAEEPKIRNFTVWKLVSGILSIIIFVFMWFQSCAVDLSATLSQAEDATTKLGYSISIIILAVGITSIAGRKSRGANIAIMIMSFIGSFVGLSNKGMYTDLKIWSLWLLIMGIFALVAYIIYQPKKK